MWETPPMSKLEDAIADPTSAIGMRMRAAYFLRQLHSNDSSVQAKVIQVLSDGLVDTRHGSLMRHEFAYVMGQLRDDRCCDCLERILLNHDDCIMVRHEAAEALGAIGASRSRTVLEEAKEINANTPEIADTCRLALNVMDWRQKGAEDDRMASIPPAACACMLNPYSSVDPAPPHPAHANQSIQELGDILCDTSVDLFERYRVMFSLRNLSKQEAIEQLCRALSTDTSSALFRHELAYVLGQTQHPASVAALEEVLRRPQEHHMVRHECAEALGAIDGSWTQVEKILTEFSHDTDQVVRESCLVALDAADYWGHNEDSQQQELSDPTDTQGSSSLSFGHQKASSGSTTTCSLKDSQQEKDHPNITTRQVIANHHFNVKV